jgi:hypothetical protein
MLQVEGVLMDFKEIKGVLQAGGIRRRWNS